MNNNFMSHSPLKILRLTVIFLAIGLVGKESNAQQLNEATICGKYADKSIGYKSGRKTSLSCDQISTFMSNSSLRESMFSDFNARFELNPNTTPQQIYQELSGVLQCERKYAPSLPELTCSGTAQGINSVINIW